MEPLSRTWVWSNVPLCRQGLGYDHDRLAAALCSSSGSLTGCLGDRIRGHPQCLCVPTSRAGRRSPSSPGTRAEAQPDVVEPDHSAPSGSSLLALPGLQVPTHSGFDCDAGASLGQSLTVCLPVAGIRFRICTIWPLCTAGY